MTDITIPAADAKRLANYLRNFHFHGMSGEQDRLIALLDPPAPSLRDEVAEAIRRMITVYGGAEMVAADVILAVVRRHVEALIEGPVCDDADCPGCVGYRDIKTVLRLLGDAE